jgi:hypothetical protein
MAAKRKTALGDSFARSHYGELGKALEHLQIAIGKVICRTECSGFGTMREFISRGSRISQRQNAAAPLNYSVPTFVGGVAQGTNDAHSGDSDANQASVQSAGSM